MLQISGFHRNKLSWYPVLLNFTRQFYIRRLKIYWRFSVPKKIINIGHNLLEIFEKNHKCPGFLRHSVEVLREYRPPPNASIIELLSHFLRCKLAMQLWTESTRYFFDNPVNPDFGLRTPGSGRWSGSSPKFIPLVPGPCPAPTRNFVKIRSQLFQLSYGQSDRLK